MLAKELLDDPIQDDEIAAALLQLAAQLLNKSKETKEKKGAANSDRLLTLNEAMVRLNVSKSWLYRRSHNGTLSFVVHNGRKLAFSEQGIEEYIRKKQGKI